MVATARRRFTADEYQEMGRTGILREDDRLELLDGEVVVKVSIGPRHNAAVSRLARHLARHLMLAVDESAQVQVQGSIRLDDYTEPEPDIVLLKPRSDFYASKLAGPSDVLLAVEVAESSLELDTTLKASLYARVAVHEYWVVDIEARSVIVHLEPAEAKYQQVHRHVDERAFAPELLSTCPVRLRDIFGD